MYRSFVSFVNGPSGAAALAADAKQGLTQHFFADDSLIHDSKVADFLAADLAQNGENSRLEECLIGIHFAHGDKIGFAVAEKDVFNENLPVFVSQLQPGWGETRYLYFLACQVLSHGRDPGRPGSFQGGPNEDSVFKRWGRAYVHSTVSTSPLAGGLRLVCGTSTHYTGGKTSFVFDLMANSGLGVADAFILGLMRPGQTPICATRASSLDPADNPLFDQTWNDAWQPPGDRVYIQYPEVVDAEDPSFAPLEGDPTNLPILRVVPDFQLLAALESDLDGLNSIFFSQPQRSDLGFIKCSTAQSADVLDAERFFANEDRFRQSFATRIPFISERLEIVKDRVQTVQMKIDSFPIAALPADGKAHPMQGNFSTEVKCNYRLASPRFRDLANLGNFYEVLDPDFGVLAGWTRRPDEDSPLIQSPILFARACSFEEEGVAQLIGREAAAQKAKEAIRAAPGELEADLDFDQPKVALAYRLDRSEGGSGTLLRPHYVVIFPQRSEENLTPVTVEVAGSG